MNTLITRLTCVALSVALTGHAGYQRDQPAGLARLELTDEAMGSSFSLVLFGPDRAGLEAAATAAFAEAHRLDRLLSNYLAESEWSAMNRAAASGPVRVTPELFALLSDCLEYSRLSDGAFDITVGPLIKVWGFYNGEGSLRQPKEVKDALNRVGYRHVELDPGPRTVRFARPGMDLDPGGIGKGYAVDRMVEVLKHAGVRIALVSASGSSIYGLADHDPHPTGSVRRSHARRPQEHVAFHVWQLREVLLGGRPNLLPHRRPADRLPRSGDVSRFRPRATDDGQRGLDETVLYQRPRLGVGAQACRVPGVLL